MQTRRNGRRAFRREVNKDASEDHVSADMFVVSRAPSAIVCAFGFDGGPPSSGSAGVVVGKEVVSVKRTGKVVAERDVVKGASSGASGAFNARNYLPQAIERNLGIFISYKSAERVKPAAAWGVDPFPTLKVKAVLEDRGAVSFRPMTSQTFGSGTFWFTGGVHVYLFEIEKTTAFIGDEQAVLVTGSGGNATAAEVLITPIPTPQDLIARLRPLGYVASGPVKEESPTPGLLRYSLRAKKGSYESTISVLDFRDAARGRNQATLRVEGKRLLIVQGASPVLGTAEQIAAEITGK